MRSSLLAVCVLVLCGCAAAKPLPAYLTTANVDAPRFPRARYLTEVGVSTSSAEDAEARARKSVSERISSQLKGETTSWLESIGAAGRSAEAQRLTESIRVSTSFSHLELARTVEREAQDGTYYALVAIDRAEADAALARDVQQESVTFTALAERALAARKQGRPGDFASAAAEADKLRGKLDAAFLVRRAVLGHASLEQEKFAQRRDALLRAEAESRTRRVVEVRVEGAHASQLLKLAVSSLRRLGVRVAENMKCEDASEWAAQDTTELVLEPEESCGEGPLGERCEVAVRLHARGCGGGGEGEGRIPQAKGLHPSDRDRARQAAWGRILSEPVIDSAVREALRGAAYLQCTTPDC